MSDNYQVHNIYQYSRKTHTSRDVPETDYHHRELDVQVDHIGPRRETVEEQPGCSCDKETEGQIASILHKKCAVITLAQQQLQRLLDNENYVCSNRHNRSVFKFLRFIKVALAEQSKCQCILMALIGISFSLGLLLGACSCGSYLGKFESPILTCLDNMFIPEDTTVQQTLRSIF